MNKEENAIYRQFPSKTRGGSVEVIANSDGKVMNFIITDEGNSIKIPFNTDIMVLDNAEKRISAKKDLIKRVNEIGRASAEAKNHLKRLLLPKLLAAGDISQEEFDRDMKNLR